MVADEPFDIERFKEAGSQSSQYDAQIGQLRKRNVSVDDLLPGRPLMQ